MPIQLINVSCLLVAVLLVSCATERHGVSDTAGCLNFQSTKSDSINSQLVLAPVGSDEALEAVKSLDGRFQEREIDRHSLASSQGGVAYVSAMLFEIDGQGRQLMESEGRRPLLYFENPIGMEFYATVTNWHTAARHVRVFFSLNGQPLDIVLPSGEVAAALDRRDVAPSQTFAQRLTLPITSTGAYLLRMDVIEQPDVPAPTDVNDAFESANANAHQYLEIWVGVRDSSKMLRQYELSWNPALQGFQDFWLVFPDTFSPEGVYKSRLVVNRSSPCMRVSTSIVQKPERMPDVKIPVRWVLWVDGMPVAHAETEESARATKIENSFEVLPFLQSGEHTVFISAEVFPNFSRWPAGGRQFIGLDYVNYSPRVTVDISSN
jgi:hypothetical protein